MTLMHRLQRQKQWDKLGSRYTQATKAEWALLWMLVGAVLVLWVTR